MLIFPAHFFTSPTNIHRRLPLHLSATAARPSRSRKKPKLHRRNLNFNRKIIPAAETLHALGTYLFRLIFPHLVHFSSSWPPPLLCWTLMAAMENFFFFLNFFVCNLNGFAYTHMMPTSPGCKSRYAHTSFPAKDKPKREK